MFEEHYSAFVDDSGEPNPDYTLDGVQRLFVSVAVVVPKDKVKSVREQFEKIKQKLNFQSEIKSSEISDNHDRRLKLLQTFRSVKDFKFVAVITDKKLIAPDRPMGLYKDVFLKVTCKTIVSKIQKICPNVSIVQDECGKPEFIESLRNYIKRTCARTKTLWDSGELSFTTADSKSDVLLQIADFIAGTVMRCYDPDLKDSNTALYEEILNERAISIQPMFSPRLSPVDVTESRQRDLDDRISEYCYKSALDFIDTYALSDEPDRRFQAKVIDYLLEQQDFEYGEHIIAETNIPITPEDFPRRIISKMREANVIIASMDSGYKIPSSKHDLILYANSIQSKAIPMLRRVMKARDLIKEMTHNQVDILNESALAEMAEVINALHDLDATI